MLVLIVDVLVVFLQLQLRNMVWLWRLPFLLMGLPQVPL